MTRYPILFFLIFSFSCVQLVEEESEETYTFTIEPNLEMDTNGMYHLSIDRNNWQTIHSVSGHVYTGNGNPVNIFSVEWDSNLLWYLCDTLGYTINRYLNNSGVYVSVDTSHIIRFNGFEELT